MFKKTIIIVGIAFSSKAHSQATIDFSNPVLIMGSSFGQYFQQLHKQGKFATMLAFTSKESRNHFSDNTIEKWYADMDFGYSLKLKSSNIAGNIKTLNYLTQISATQVIIRMKIILENDTAKIILPADFLHQKIFLYR